MNLYQLFLTFFLAKVSYEDSRREYSQKCTRILIYSEFIKQGEEEGRGSQSSPIPFMDVRLTHLGIL